MNPFKFHPRIQPRKNFVRLGSVGARNFGPLCLVGSYNSPDFPAFPPPPLVEARTTLHILNQNSFLEPCLTRKHNRGTAARRHCHLDARRGDTIVALRCPYSSLRCVALRCVAPERESMRLKENEKELVLDGLLLQQQQLLLLLL